MKGLNLKVLKEVSDQLGVPSDEVQGCFEALEEEGHAFRAKDEVSGKELWFPIEELDDQNVQ